MGSKEKLIRELKTAYWVDKVLIILLVVFFSIHLTSASILNASSGETINITLDKTYYHYYIIGNSTEIIFDKVIQEGNIVYITLNKYNKDDSFEIVFFDIKNEEIPIIQSSTNRGGSSHTNTIIKKINNTEYIEVPNYINNETIKLVENKTTETKYVELNKPKWWMVGVGILLVGIIIGLLFFIMKNYDSDSLENIEDINERGLNENE